MRILFLATLLFSLSLFAEETKNYEEELLLFGEDDLLLSDEEQPVAPKKSDTTTNVSQNSDTTLQDSLSSDSTTVVAQENDSSLSQDSLAVVHDSSSQDSLALAQQDTTLLDSTTTQDSLTTDSLTPEATVIALSQATLNQEKAIAIDKSSDEYRSPQKALFLSLLLPGAGQAYAKRYWKTGLFGAIEIGAIVGAIVMNKKGDNYTADAYQFVDDNFSADSLKFFYEHLYAWGQKHEWYQAPLDTLNSVDSSMFFGSYRDIVDTATGIVTKKGYEIYVDSVKAHLYDYAKDVTFAAQGWSDLYGSYDTNAVAGTIAGPNDFYRSKAWSMSPDDKAIYQNEAYATAQDAFDAGATFLHIINVGPQSSSYGQRTTGYSAQQAKYKNMLDDANSAYKGRNIFLIGLVINHIASATDALLTARKYNRELLKEEVVDSTKQSKVKTFMNTMSIDNGLYYTQESGVTTKVGLSWRF